MAEDWHGYSSSTKRRRKKVKVKKPEKKAMDSLTKERIISVFGEMVTRRKPNFYESWSLDIRKNYFDISISSAQIYNEIASVYIQWNFIATKRYCCTSPPCFIGRNGPDKLGWWKEFRKNLKALGTDVDKLPKLRLSVEVNVPEVEVAINRAQIGPDGDMITKPRFTMTHANQRSYDWFEPK